MEKLKLNHEADCLCKAFGTTCDRIQEMKSEMEEIIKRADNNSESIELAWEAGRTLEEKVLYTFLMGNKFSELARGEQSNSVKELPSILGDILREVKRRRPDNG